MSLVYRTEGTVGKKQKETALKEPPSMRHEKQLYILCEDTVTVYSCEDIE